jgi:outer membrane protein assembly complex protein YaeT
VPRLAALVAVLLAARSASAVQLDALDLATDWQLRALIFRGAKAVRPRELRKALVTKTRPWFAVWRDWPPFDPVAFRTDLERIRRTYEARGYYHARVLYDIELPRKGHAIRAVVYIEEGSPVTVERVDVDLRGATLPPRERESLLGHLPIWQGAVFTDDAYQAARTYLRAYYREHAYARVEVTPRAEVDLARDLVTVSYVVDSGPETVFGTTEITGTVRVDPEIVRREFVFDPGEPFRQSLIDRTRANLVGLNLFRAVRIDEDPGQDKNVDLRVEVDEAPPREIRFGVGYDTEEQVRGLASWRNYNFLGGARQLGFSARASVINRTLLADFLQPHFPGRANRTRLSVSETQEVEDPFTLDRTRLSPRLEWEATRRITGFLFHRFEYDSLSDVNQGIKNAIPGVAPSNDVLSGIGTGADWNATDDLIDPTRGWVASATVEGVGGVLGGDLTFVRFITEGRVYLRLFGKLRSAVRLRLGAADPLGSTEEIPLYERFYVGGINSVRGYGRWRVGPFVGDEPVGGRTVVETSVELRHPITETFGGAVFLDGGRASRQSFTFPFTTLRYGTGFGVRYKSPVGPLRLDLGFPLEPQQGDQHWQIYVSLGASF